MYQHTCRMCGRSLSSVYSFGRVPLANVYSPAPHKRFPLIFSVCKMCGLYQLGYIVSPKSIFPHYGYVSGSSQPLVRHLQELAGECIKRLKLTKRSAVLDIGANDGTFLAAFGRRVGLRVGVDPAGNLGRAVGDRDIRMVPEFFGNKTAAELVRKLGTFDLISVSHTLANVTDMHDFLRGITRALAPDGTVVIEVGSVDTIVRHGDFDGIYHEHYTYFSRKTITQLLALHGLRVISARTLQTQGGSILVFAKHGRVSALKQEKPDLKKLKPLFIKNLDTYIRRMNGMMSEYRGKTVVGVGAPAKAVTLVHACGLAPYLCAFVDSTPVKQGQLFPGTNVRIYPEEYLAHNAIDALIVFSWNYADAVLPKIKKLVSGRPDIIIPFPKLKKFSFRHL